MADTPAPATDEELDRFRTMPALPAGHLTQQQFARRLLARIDAERARNADLQRQIDEALQLTECCTSLRDMAAAVVEGAATAARVAKLEAALRLIASVIPLDQFYSSGGPDGIELDEYVRTALAAGLNPGPARSKD